MKNFDTSVTNEYSTRRFTHISTTLKVQKYLRFITLYVKSRGTGIRYYAMEQSVFVRRYDVK